jgi:hypothetical protein
MTRKNRHDELHDEVLAVLECSPNLVPCEEFRNSDIYAFADHLKEGTCEQCLAFYHQVDKELRTMKLLSDFKKRNVQ